MSDLIERLHTAVITEVNPIDELTYPTMLGREAADEIERLRATNDSLAVMAQEALDKLDAETQRNWSKEGGKDIALGQLRAENEQLRERLASRDKERFDRMNERDRLEGTGGY